jgi:AraC-like DNA-binding protein
MADYEKRFIRDGVPMPIQCITMRQNKRKDKITFHYHDYTELLFGVEGTADVFVGSNNYKLSQGDMVIIHNYELHDVNGTGSPSKYIVLKFLPSVLLTAEQTYSEYSYALCLMQNTDRRQSFFGRNEFENTTLPSLFHHAMDEWNGGKFGYELSLRADVTSIFLYILRKWHEKNIEDTAVSRPQGELIQKAISYVNDNYVDITEQIAAEALGVSPSYLSRVFKKGMKRSFSSYVTSIKLREAERMLISTDMSITEIGECVGFSTSAYFIANFKAEYKETPSKYRRSCRK